MLSVPITNLFLNRVALYLLGVWLLNLGTLCKGAQTENQAILCVLQLWVVFNKGCFNSTDPVHKFRQVCLSSSVLLVVLSMRKRLESGSITSAIECTCRILPDLIFHFYYSVGDKNLKQSNVSCS